MHLLVMLSMERLAGRIEPINLLLQPPIHLRVRQKTSENARQRARDRIRPSDHREHPISQHLVERRPRLLRVLYVLVVLCDSSYMSAISWPPHPRGRHAHQVIEQVRVGSAALEAACSLALAPRDELHAPGADGGDAPDEHAEPGHVSQKRRCSVRADSVCE